MDPSAIFSNDEDFISWGKTLRAYRVFRDFGSWPANSNTKRVFLKFLGLPESAKFYETEKLSQDAKTKINMLLGPHGATIYKAYMAKHNGEGL